ncbi:MAG: hypothetical protein ACPGWR_23195 [Ardenticatenaceae bacterium]
MDKLITEMSPEEFDAVIDKYIERESQDTGELPAEVFFEALQNIFSAEAQNVEETIILDGEVVGSQLELYLPDIEQGNYVMVRDNEILVDNLRIVIDLV